MAGHVTGKSLLEIIRFCCCVNIMLLAFIAGLALCSVSVLALQDISPESGIGRNSATHHIDSVKDKFDLIDNVEKCPEVLVSAFKWKQSNLVFIDLRSPGDYRLQHIPESLNLPFFALKTKSFLKQSTLVLVDKGYSEKASHKRCRQLKAQGFNDVRVLKGGVYAWVRASSTDPPGQSIQYDQFRSFASIAPRSYYFNQDQIWMLVNATDLLPQTIAKLFEVAEEQVMAAGASRQVLADNEKALMKKTAEDDAAEFTIVYLVLGKGDKNGKAKKSPQEFSRLYKILENEKIFYLQGGVVRYQAYLAQQYAMINQVADRNAAKSLCSVN